MGWRAGLQLRRHLPRALRADRQPRRRDRAAEPPGVHLNLNVPSRWGTQTPFTNLTFDWVCPEDLRAQHPLIGGEPASFTYGDLGPEVDLINRAFLRVMAAGDARGRVFRFPIPTDNITADFPWESETADLLFEVTAKYGLPYFQNFQNFLNSDLQPGMVRSMCCRLQLDLRTTVHPALLRPRDRTDLQFDLHQLGLPPSRWPPFRPQGCEDPELTGSAQI